MTKSKIKFISIIALVCLGIRYYPDNANAQTRDLQKFVDSIRSVEQVKKNIGKLIVAIDNCAVGSCFNFNSTAICELVATLDVQVNGQIVGGMTSVGSAGKIPISKSDLSLMQDIFSQCKPTNYQY
ncbi:hypothetical protein Syn7502_03304 [Synechococcus sp. PCC 7502]|uniref:hypothetical protein n=1 Tax=Synechococcus sp. PCC 7502 TaxID=1173263 RepID=UPI00029FD78E|nr:hypothetical protein [Synechococcus sp. PCC 7502]AFY75170.1 hypothetical protein Syn7502_03304 [Synechococcus sp. PCC 7502]